MRRRSFLAASAVSLALPAVVQAENTRVLKFIPQSDLAILDPVWTTAYVTRNHSYMVYDTLFGQAGQKDGFKATPQMLAGYTVESDGNVSGGEDAPTNGDNWACRGPTCSDVQRRAAGPGRPSRRGCRRARDRQERCAPLCASARARRRSERRDGRVDRTIG